MFHRSLFSGLLISLKGYEEDARVPDWYRWRIRSSHPGISKSKDTNRAEISNSLLFRKVTGIVKGWLTTSEKDWYQRQTSSIFRQVEYDQ